MPNFHQHIAKQLARGYVVALGKLRDGQPYTLSMTGTGYDLGMWRQRFEHEGAKLVAIYRPEAPIG